MTVFSKIKKIGGQTYGTTLVELMVSFVLTAILMTAAIATISPAVRVFNRVVGMSRAQGVTDILLEEISQELESAERIMTIGSARIDYADKNGQGVSMMLGAEGAADGGQELAGMLILYYGSEDIQWYLPEKTYMGFKLTELDFRQVDDRNLIEVTVKIKNSRSGIEYERTKIVECYKLGDGEITVD